MAGVREPITIDLAGRRVAVTLIELGLACCGIEVRAASRLLREALELVPAGSASGAAAAAKPMNVLVVAGTITHATAAQVLEAYQELREPRAVLAFGACAISGGPYWDSYAIVPGAGRLVDVDAFVPGCPPRPEELLAGVRELLR